MKDTPEFRTEVHDVTHEKRLADPERLQALARTGMMDSPAPGAHQRAARVAARLLNAPVSLVSFVDDKRQFFSAQTGITGPAAEERGTPISHSFCQYVVSSEKPLIVPDAEQDPVLCSNGAVQDLKVRAYLGVPIRSPDGHVLGSFCVIDERPREWTDDDLAQLSDIAEMIESDLRLRETLEERDIVLQEMRHRVKNLFTMINSILRMERRSHDTADELAESVGARLKALSDAHEMIVPVVNARRSEGATTTLDALTRKLLAPHGSEHETRIVIRGEHVPVGPKAAVYLTLALHELATNAAKYGGLSTDGGQLTVQWRLGDKEAVEISWEETGLAWDTDATPRSGFGSRLLSIAVEGQLAGQIDTVVDTDRFVRRLQVPFARLQA
ncbi:GAF domain-containing protein [Mameliella sediminis]|uniref:GAF domain-containing protein n=1 Tax=Mameliella sediminis TaxID=2836866 RepID=UPI001C48D4FE|nr:GAF domain-containing protein [Mameliella sediminis]MBY6112939.1 GAF domain-containing protein [Antarctobacter heliothermus]MBY6143713.1 GAF domain-containing protein [Mameliella alba]MBV7394221.1 GAF domain-containing protein [Mameliella sediminis]MBY6162367.1 GAF domain-containing protein [Mameliella alba]MBY6170841.1 GAF domain-containing protein [Mameliella alba]